MQWPACAALQESVIGPWQEPLAAAVASVYRGGPAAEAVLSEGSVPRKFLRAVCRPTTYSNFSFAMITSENALMSSSITRANSAPVPQPGS
jgi:hypothetical protein